MHKEMRRKDRKLSEEITEKLLDQSIYGILSTSDPDSYPYGTPLNYVYSDGNIYFHCAKDTGLKIENIKKNSKVSFTVVGYTNVLSHEFAMEYESAVAFGNAKEVFDDEKGKALKALIMKYSLDYKDEGMKYIDKFYEKTSVYKIEIDFVTGKGRI